MSNSGDMGGFPGAGYPAKRKILTAYKAANQSTILFGAAYADIMSIPFVIDGDGLDFFFDSQIQADRNVSGNIQFNYLLDGVLFGITSFSCFNGFITNCSWGYWAENMTRGKHTLLVRMNSNAAGTTTFYGGSFFTLYQAEHSNLTLAIP